MPVVSALLLDVDDTLIDTRGAMIAAAEAAVADLWPDLGPEVRRAAATRFHADPSGFFGRFTRGEMSFVEMRQARVADLVEAFSLAMVHQVNGRFDDAYAPAFSASVRVFEDVWPLVRTASEAGIPMGLLTNSSAQHTRQKLEITDLTGVFVVVATRDTLGFGKPDARAFHHACGLLGMAPAQTLYVGDDLEIDAIGARDAGLRAAWLQRDPADPRGAARARACGIPLVGSLSEVSDLL